MTETIDHPQTYSGMRTLVAVLMLTLLAACGSEPHPSEGAVRTVERATVTDVPGGDGPILCTGPVRESAPPQCEGPVISNWDWDKVWGAAGEAGARFGDFCFEGKDVGDTFQLTTLPRPVGTCEEQEYRGFGTVLENKDHGPQLCLGAVATSYPVQCGGPDITNWDWTRTKPTTEIGESKDGLYVVHGVYVSGDFILTRPPKAWDESDAQPEEPMRDFTTPCPEPAGGWFPKDRPRLDELAVDRAAPFAETIPGYSELWLDQQFNKGIENDPNKTILNLRVTKDAKDAETAMRNVWKGALCVSEAKHTNNELQRIQDEAGRAAGKLLLGSSSGNDQVDVDVIVDQGGRLQEQLDAKYGTGTVRVNSALVEAPPGM
ncbi:hypothetical protein [Aeromicrobium panaciterrae]|uniref:hypothetical protein n=1 Tax=Aeromicrobium panaciterrae TaxID=363861 RepID=UPI0031E1E58F